MQLKHILPALMLGVASLSAYANDGANDRRPPQHGHMPPPEALAACKGKAAGSKAQLTAPDGHTVTGTCQLVLLPDENGEQGQGPRGQGGDRHP